MRRIHTIFGTSLILLGFFPGLVAAQTPPAAGSAPIPTGSTASIDGASASGSVGSCNITRDCPIGKSCVSNRCVDSQRGRDGWACSVIADCVQDPEYGCLSGRCVCSADGGCGDQPNQAPVSENTRMIEQVEGHITAPVLAVPIPGLAAFQNPIVQGSEGQRYLDIPFLAQYISAVYTYALGIIVTIATVMVVIGGVKWMLARGDSGKVSDAKETLSRAVIGVLLALGSYAILNLINPELVNLRALRIQLVERNEVDTELLETREDTRDIETSGGAPTGGGGGGGGRTGGFASCRTPSSGSGCPVSLTEAVTCSNPREARTQQFLAAIGSHCSRGREGVVCAAQAAARCGVHMGSCLATAQALARSTGATIQQRPGREVNSGLLAPAQAEGNTCRSAGGSEADCRRRARNVAATAIAAAKPGWPDAWIRELNAGDMIRVYNGRPGGSGQHSAIFISMGGGGYANVVHASYGHYVTSGRLCISRSCNGVLTKTYATQ